MMIVADKVELVFFKFYFEPKLPSPWRKITVTVSTPPHKQTQLHRFAASQPFQKKS